MVSSEPLSAPQMPTWVGSVPSLAVRNWRLKPVVSAPAFFRAATAASSVCDPSPFEARSTPDEAGTVMVAVRVRIVGSAMIASRTANTAPGESISAPPLPKALTAASSITAGRLALASTRSALPTLSAAGSTRMGECTKSMGRAISVRVKPRRPLDIIEMSRESEEAGRQQHGAHAQQAEAPLGAIAAGNALAHRLALPVSRRAGGAGHHRRGLGHGGGDLAHS